MLTESELKVMNVVWANEDIKASDLYKIMEKKTNWNKNTSYTMIKKCIEKGYIERIDPEFHCKPLISKDTAQEQFFNNILDKFFNNSKTAFFQAFVNKEKLTDTEINELKEMVDKIKD